AAAPPVNPHPRQRSFAVARPPFLPSPPRALHCFQLPSGRNFALHFKNKFFFLAMPGMMEKGSEYLGKGRSNGTKSPAGGASSNGHYSEESGSDDEHGDVGMRVGSDYQASIPEFNPGKKKISLNPLR
ncbi:hypothetical protein scyTo_0017423, partial [Scyliorhinus torazame]|nr:hypothetical protein [Scyliorhinus torazame]